ncbi:conserved Plasmodium protein, unknown function [Plasmodium ovale]|uniref:Uncharacterized protein n=1 Tax=Plasmodium ovale TaxID=36330 RepID=A0A1D3TLH5_PLAOA|nr:conserved Plasmodium protein, unknown function [Plasmodium ovale]
MATKIRYSVHTTNKFSVFDTDNSEEENENKNMKVLSESEINNTYEEGVNNNNHEVKKISDNKKNNSTPLIKEYNTKKVSPTYNDRYNKYPISSSNDLNENGYNRSSYRDNFHLRGNNIRNKFPRKRGSGYSNASTNIMGNSSFYKGSRNYDYKMNTDRRNYNSSYSYNKFDIKEKMFNDYNDSSGKYENKKRENYLELKNKNHDENKNIARKHESVTIDYDLYRKQQEKKLISNKSSESVDRKKKKNEIINEKSSKINNTITKRNDNIEEENKADHPKRKAINVYQYILEEGGRVDKIPGFRSRFRSFKKRDDANWNSKSDINMKMQIDEKIFQKRDPPNINDTRAFPSLTSK